MSTFKNISKIVLSGSLLVAAASCTDGFEKTNTDLKSTLKVSPEFLLPTVETKLMNHYTNSDVNSNVTAIQAQHFAQYNYNDESGRYNFRDGLLDSYIGDYYNAILGAVDIDKIVASKSDDELSPEKKAAWTLITTTLRAFAMQHVTDANGPAIFTEAFDINNKTPKYDSQKDIYTALLEQLYAASSAASTATDLSLGAQDIVYAGDIAKWQKFANSILLRLAMRIADVDPAMSKDYFNKAVNENGGVFTSNADNAVFTYLASPNGSKMFESVLDTWSPGISPSNTLYDLQKANKDPRFDIYWAPTYWGDTGAVTYGDKSATFWYGAIINPKYAGYKTIGNAGRYYSDYYAGKQDTPGVYIDYAEVAFFLAEAAVRGGYAVSGTAEEHYNKAVEASIRFQAGVVGWDAAKIDTAVTDYLALASTKLSNATDKLAKIAEEKWVALFLQGPEAWAEVRRLDAPTMNVPSGKKASDAPTRLLFSTREKILNTANVDDAKAILKGGIDTYTTKLWWDTK